MVANISETACEAIGANGLLARVGAYYHDLGKTVQPHYFIENQLSVRNPHDFLDPKKVQKLLFGTHTMEQICWKNIKCQKKLLILQNSITAHHY